MGVDLQRASMWKRISAWLFDGILLVSIVVLVMYGLSAVFHYDKYDARLDSVYQKYEDQYQIDFGEPEGAEGLTDQEREAYKLRYDDADKALRKDAEAIAAYSKVTNLYMLLPTLSLLIAMLVMEFAIPMVLKNGQTLGKKIFAIGVVRVDLVKVTRLQMFVRSILSKYTVGMMIPLYLLLFCLFGVMGGVAFLLALGLILLQWLLPLFNRDHRGLHDFLSGTVTVDLPSQRVFDNPQARLEYIQKVHQERAARQDY